MVSVLWCMAAELGPSSLPCGLLFWGILLWPTVFGWALHTQPLPLGIHSKKFNQTIPSFVLLTWQTGKPTFHLEKSPCYLVAWGEGGCTIFLFLSAILLVFWEVAERYTFLPSLLHLTRCQSQCLQKNPKISPGSPTPPPLLEPSSRDLKWELRRNSFANHSLKVRPFPTQLAGHQNSTCS